MSLETLLEAAEFLEWRNNPKTRGESSPRETYSYAALSTIDSDGSPESSNSGKLSGNEEGKEKRRAGGAGTREVHNKLEKNRRAHLKECFEFLKNQIPTLEDKRTSNLSILRGSLRYIQALRRKEKEYELEMQRLAREKITLQEKMASLKSELTKMNIEIDLNMWVTIPDEQDTNSTSTATEQGSPICSDDEEDEELLAKSRQNQMYTVQTVHEAIRMPLPPSKTYQSWNATSQPLSNAIAPAVNTPVRPMAVPNPVPNVARQKVPVSSTSAMTTAAVASTVTPVRPPVTQILAQALSQRQFLQRQQSLTAQNAAIGVAPAHTTTTSAIGKQLVQPSFMKSLQQIHTPLALTPLTAQMPSAAAVTHLAALNKLMGSALINSQTTATSLSHHQNSSTLSKALATQPILVAPGLQMASATTPISNSITSVSSLTSNVNVTTATPTLVSIGSLNSPTQTVASGTNQMPTASQHSSGVVTAATVQAVRPTIIGTAGGAHHIMTAGQLTPLNTILAQQLPRTNMTALPTIAGSMAQGSSMQQLMSFAQMAPGTQLVSPVVMPPGVHLAASGLTQAQIQSMLAQPLLKQIPIFSPSVLQAGQVIGQSVVKPFVMVTVPSVASVPSVVSTTTATVSAAPSVHVAVTSNS